MPAGILADRKRDMINELNKFIGMKKDASEQYEQKSILLDGTQPVVGMGNEGARLTIYIRVLCSVCNHYYI
jgi:hypothetical protein